MKQIHTTTDYSIFKTLRGNREITPKRFNAVKESIEMIGWITNPIIVNENMEVVDGQARLAVLKSKDMPVDYIIEPGLTIRECQEMNLRSTIWTAEQMIKSNAVNGIDGAEKLLKLMDEFNLPASTACIPCGIHRSSLKKQARTISITDETYMKARNFLLFYKKVEPFLKKLNGRKNAQATALFYIFEHGVDMNEMISAIAKMDHDAFNATKIETMIKSFQEAYNFNKKSKKNRIYVYESYRKGE